MHKIKLLAITIFMVIAILHPFVTKPPVNEEPKKDQVTLPEIGDKPDFKSFTDVNAKKKAFFDYLRPGVLIENDRVGKERAYLLQIKDNYNQGNVTLEQQSYARRIGDLYYYELPEAGVNRDWIDGILDRVNLIPEALVLTQAANESAWGTSRFALEANNYFGQWCYKKGCGLIPLQRTEGSTHEVAKFDSVGGSINAYFMNVNRNRAYQSLRQIRNQLETSGNSIISPEAAIEMAKGLVRYSERGNDYVSELQSMIRVNHKFWEQKQ